MNNYIIFQLFQPKLKRFIKWAIAFFIRYPQVEDTRISNHFTKVSTGYPSTLSKIRPDIRAHLWNTQYSCLTKHNGKKLSYHAEQKKHHDNILFLPWKTIDFCFWACSVDTGDLYIIWKHNQSRISIYLMQNFYA